MVVRLGGASNTSIGPEIVQVQAMVQIIDHLPEQLAKQEAAWNPLDERLAQRLEMPFRPTPLELPPRGSYYSGARLGILNMPWSTFPAIAVMADGGGPTAESSGLDYGAVNAISLFIELVVRSEQFDHDGPTATPEQQAARLDQEGVADRRAKRSMEAIIQCIALDRSLGGLVPPLPDPTFGQTDAFSLNGTVPEDVSHKRVFSLVRIQYSSNVYATFPDAMTPAPPVLPGAFGGVGS